MFKKPFQPKKAAVRKNITISPLKLDAAERAREFGLDYGNAYLRLNEHLIKFDPQTGDWIIDGSGSHRSNNTSNKEVQKLQKTNQQLQEENNLLKVKTEILVDMVTEIYCEDKLNREQRPRK